MTSPYVLWPDDPAAPAAAFGGKAGALRRLADAGLPVPPFFVVSPDAWRQSRASAGSYPDDQEIAPDTAVAEAIAAAVQRLDPAPGARFAVRSSAVDEDGAGHSFAGQFESFLNAEGSQVAERVAAVWRSGFTERVRAYRKERGLSPDPTPPAVLVQRMVPADVSGVAFSADPVSARRAIAVVAAVPGLGTALVGGDADADTWEIDRSGAIVGRHVADKSVVHRTDSEEGVRAETLPPDVAGAASLTDEQALAVAALARQAERDAGRPQDIEWAIEGTALHLLQSRPITTLAGRPDPDGARGVFDNSNIAESYNGVTTPLTFSFARNAYEQVYREFCRILSVPPKRIAARDLAFRNLLGLVEGRVYYNLPNWYRLLALLPGYRLNRTYMEQMMGVREPLPEDAVPDLSVPPSAAEKRGDVLALARTVRGLVRHHRRLPATIADFYRRLDTALATPQEALAGMRADELAAHYHDLERQLLYRWDAPLVNDFLAMFFHGVLRRLTAKWVARDDAAAESLHNDLIGGGGGIVSAEPAQRVSDLARRLAGDDEAVRILADSPPGTALRWLSRARPEIARSIDDYLERFGDRCLEELKLESATLDDDPTPLLRAVAALAARGGSLARPPSDGPSPRQAAEARVEAALQKSVLRRRIYAWVLAQARDRVRDRENLRFERTRVFGRVRRIFVEIGKRFVADGLLDDPRDIFYLEAEEALGAIEGTATCPDLRGLAAVRRTAVEAWRARSPLADRIETRGTIGAAGSILASAPTIAPAPEGGEDDRRRGLACCPGIVRGPVRVVTDPRGATLPAGSILVAERTDPGWILLFPAASGLLVERGSLLSHSAIVARELGLPCIVSVPGVTSWLTDGETVEMDGATGWVRRVAESETVQETEPGSTLGKPENTPEAGIEHVTESGVATASGVENTPEPGPAVE